MLTSRGSGRYLSRDWHDQRDAAVRDSTHLDADTKAHLEITGSTGANPPKRYTAKTTPMDASTEITEYEVAHG
jgi:hypothetical protein